MARSAVWLVGGWLVGRVALISFLLAEYTFLSMVLGLFAWRFVTPLLDRHFLNLCTSLARFGATRFRLMSMFFNYFVTSSFI